jgi:hypothetical protein
MGREYPAFICKINLGWEKEALHRISIEIEERRKSLFSMFCELLDK